MPSVDPKLTKLQDSFRKLASTATALNRASDELTHIVNVLEEALQKLNVGVSVWVSCEKWSNEDQWGEIQIGYVKIAKKWGIALQTVTGDHYSGEPDFDGPWAFGDSARELRIEAVEHLPKLIQKLSEEAGRTTAKLTSTLAEVKELTKAIIEIAETQKSEEPKGAQ